MMRSVTILVFIFAFAVNALGAAGPTPSCTPVPAAQMTAAQSAWETVRDAASQVQQNCMTKYKMPPLPPSCQHIYDKAVRLQRTLSELRTQNRRCSEAP